MKKLPCSICGDLLEVDDEATKATCEDCLIGKDDPWLYLEKTKPQKDIWVGAQKMRNKGMSLSEIANRLGVNRATISRHTVAHNV